MRYDMQMNGRIHVSIFRTTRRSMALSFKSGTYVEPTAKSCSTAPLSVCLTFVVVMLGKITRGYERRGRHNATQGVQIIEVKWLFCEGD
jgi:hypothetical protein